jgi:uncharacterized cupin superfamily protein
MEKEIKALGKKLRELRRTRNMTILDVSKVTGIDIASLSRMENGKMTGTFKSHLALSKALGVRLPDLYEKVLEMSTGDDAEPKNADPVQSISGSITSEMLSGLGGERKMAPIRLTIKAGAMTLNEEFPLGAERFLYVIRGKIDVVFRESTRTLKDGDSLYFNAATPHHFVNRAGRESTCLVVTTYPQIDIR